MKYLKSTVLLSLFLLSTQGFSKLAIMQGLTNEHSSQISIVHLKQIPITISVRDQDGKSIPINWERDEARSFSDWAVYNFEVNHLEPGQKYQLSVLSDKNEILDNRLFSALTTKPHQVKIALISCVNDYMYWPPIWKQLKRQKPEVIFFLGDNVYADAISAFKHTNDADEAFIWGRYVHTFNKISFFKNDKLTPTFSIWDDHDYGQNNGTSKFKYKKESEAILKAFMARYDYPMTNEPANVVSNGPGISFKLNAFGMDFYFLDDRSFKTDLKADGIVGLLGDAQENWLFSDMGQPSKNPVWIINGMQNFFTYKKGEGYNTSFPADFAQFLQKIKSTSRKVTFLSGDIHFSEILKIESDILGYETREITSSAMHSDSIPGIELVVKNKRKIKATGFWNFVMLDITPPTEQKTYMEYKAKSWGGFPLPLWTESFRL